MQGPLNLSGVLMGFVFFFIDAHLNRILPCPFEFRSIKENVARTGRVKVIRIIKNLSAV